MNRIRWGILATGRIARSFAGDLAVLPDAEIAAVASRSRESAAAFVAEYAPGADPLGSYAELAARTDLDVVYVASPHGLHHQHVRMLLEAGLPVLCEKSLTLNAAQAEELFALARERNLFLMEAMWMACHPLIRHLRERISAGDFGEPRQLVADLGFAVDRPPTDRLLAPELGGGALLDMGIYPLTLAQLWLGDPAEQTGVATLAPSGIDLDVAISARYPNGAVAALTTSMSSWSSRAATLATSAGRLELPAPAHHPGHAIWTRYLDGKPLAPERIEPPEPVLGTGLGNEAAHVQDCVRRGRITSEWVPPEQTLAVLHQMDALRSRFGVRYPGEAPVKVPE